MELKKGDEVLLWTRRTGVYNGVYPFSPEGISVPIRVLEEYPRWYLCLVLPHVNPAGFGKDSLPYRITIPKHDIISGAVTIKPIGTKESTAI